MIFVVDCDYDSATGRIRGGLPSLVITDNADVEADLVQLGTLRLIAQELVPSALQSESALSGVVEALISESEGLASVVGRARLATARHGLALNFDQLRIARMRRRGQGIVVDEETLARVLVQRTNSCRMSIAELAHLIRAERRSFRVCNGHDLVEAVACVLHQEYGVQEARLTALPHMIRMAVTDDRFAQWMVSRRIRAWQAITHAIVLRP
jgi:hypothetical protein